MAFNRGKSEKQKNDEINNEKQEICDWSSLQELGDFQITPCKEKIDFSNKEKYEKISLTDAHKFGLSGALANIPLAGAAVEMGAAYKVTFPKGVPHTLMRIRGGYGSPILKNGRIVGHASFVPMVGNAAALGVFSALSVITGQYFLTLIHKEFKQLNLKLDKIIEFLYEQKRTETLSAIGFVKNVAENYSTIMEHEEQRIATLGNVQRVKMIAFGNIEFYLSDLKSIIEECNGEKHAEKICDKIDNNIERTQRNIELSMELYFMSCLLEVYLSQNCDTGYIENIEADIRETIKICNDRVLKSFGVLEGFIKNGMINKKDQEMGNKYLSEYAQLPEELNKKYKKICDTTSKLLRDINKKQELYVTAEGEIYI